MAATPREIVHRSLKFESPGRVPRDLWLLPWASIHFPQEVEELRRRYPSDFCTAPDVYRASARRRGDPYVPGTYTDEWGCNFTNIQAGVHGEVRQPLISDLRDWKQVKPPYEILPENWHAARDLVNRYCAGTNHFVLAAACPRLWERYQFVRGSENSLMDMAIRDDGVKQLLHLIHDYYLQELEFWKGTEVDALSFMDDWGMQKQLLISPQTWREIFKPFYREYCDLAHSRGKFIFMHSDGNITDIYPDLIEIGVDAINSQLFCMELEVLARLAKGRITFWGEIDRQHVLPARDPDTGRRAVREVVRHLYDPKGGVIAQLEFGPDGNPDTVMAVYDEWEKATGQS